MNYATFLADKEKTAPPCGFAVDLASLPPLMKPFQRDVTAWALRRGRAAMFEGTGLGKTLQELAWADAVYRETGQPVLIVAPLAVAEQTVEEAQKFGVQGVNYAADLGKVCTPIAVTNYDRAHLFDLECFGGVVLDESSILKAEGGATRKDLTERCAAVPYLLAATATPAPNDWTEIGQHAEFLGVMTAKEMLAMYFVHDGSNRLAGSSDGWRLKRHAENDFWRWVASWAVMIRHPRDLGQEYDEAGYDLPPLVKKQITVAVPYEPGNGTLFPMEALTLSERIGARRTSLEPRVKAAADIVNAEPNEPWLVWCHLNAEADALVKAIPGAVQVQGADRREAKAANLLGFAHGRPRVLVSKPSIAGWGLNYQHCNRMVFVGLSDSFEQLYQAIRRCWRFGQERPVTVYMIASELEGAVVANLDQKERDFERMSEAMASHMRDLTRQAIRQGRVSASAHEHKTLLKLPEWI